MMNKLFKNIFILCLCFSSLIVTNAAISVSDGSAFITKAEFSADLNNLSSRLATLENSLDAKIDSLVSTYLSRNGIWNGAKVEIDQSETHLTNSDFIQSWTSKASVNKLVWSKTATVSKSGMCVLSLHVEGVSNGYSQYRCYLRYSGGNWTGFEDDVRVILWLDEIISGISYTKYALQIGSSYQRVTDGHASTTGSCIVSMPNNNDYVLLAFVSKGNNINVGITQYVSDFSTGNSTISTYAFAGGAYLNVYISDCLIY